jgi:fibronectin type 3 domain-containing protein
MYHHTRDYIIPSVLCCILFIMIISGCSKDDAKFSQKISDTTSPSSTTILLAWSEPTSYTTGSILDPAIDIKEYRIYYRTEAASYSTGSCYPVPAPATSVPVTNVISLGTGTYYFVVTAVDQTKMESDFSNEVSKYFN